MKKEHQSPEFVVIKQDQANAKFFVASTVTFTGTTNETESGEEDAAAEYGRDEDGFTM